MVYLGNPGSMRLPLPIPSNASLEMYDLRRRMGARAWERVRKRFTVDMAVEQTLRTYDSLPNNSG